MRDDIVRIGHQGDNHAFIWSHSVKDILQKYGSGGEFACRIRRSGDVDAYPKDCELDDDTLKVIFNTTDMQFVGIGELQYEYRLGEIVKCSEVFKFMVERSLGEGDAPIPWIGWIQKVEQNARDAKDAADRSQEFAESVINLTVEAEEIPAGEQIRVTKSISDKVINLLFRIPKAVFPQLFPWADITGKPSAYPPSEHDHDELYYGKTYIDEHTEDDVVHTSYEEKRQWNSAVWSKHTHANKLVLDSITQALIDKIDGMYSREYIDRHIDNGTVHTNDSERAKWNRASQDRHTHPNKLTLDSIPAIPTGDGEYVLKCTVTNGRATVSWVRV